MSISVCSENLVRYKVRAKYIRQSDGSLRLVSVQSFNVPRFKESGWEEVDQSENHIKCDSEKEVSEENKASNIERASRRAKINAFDTILCNPDLDTFATFTYRPDDTVDRSEYDSCYKVLSVWLSNRVQRKGLKYVIVPEHHKSGDIHFHGILNSSALKLTPAFSPRTGLPLTSNGSPIYNLVDWKSGFSTAQIIGSGADDRDKVAKYIFKYMGKQCGQRIGGRYALIGGDLSKPVYSYGDDISEFVEKGVEKYSRTVNIGDDLVYTELNFL